MTQTYTDPRALERMRAGTCPECGGSPEGHGSETRFWMPGNQSCSLLERGVVDRIEHQRKLDGEQSEESPVKAASYVGSSKARQEVGQPGHCDECAAYGHVAAHPELGCSDVGCDRAHEPYGPPGEDEPVRPAKLMVCMRCTGLGRPLVEVPHGIGNAFQREVVATIYRQDGGGPGWDDVLIITPHLPDCSHLAKVSR